MNCQKLKDIMMEKGITQKRMALKLGISVHALNAKLNNRSSLNIGEATKIKEILNINNPSEIFFTLNVPKMQRIQHNG